MSTETEQRLLDFGKWYDHHKETKTDIDKRSEFLEKAIDNLAHLMIHYVEDIRVLEGRGPLGSSNTIISPAGTLMKTAQRPTLVSMAKREKQGKMDLSKLKDGE